MNHTLFRLLRGCAMLLLLGFGVFEVKSAYGVVQCENPTMTNLTFGNVDPQSTLTDVTATFSIMCENNLLLQTRAATLCLSIGEPGGGPIDPRQMKNGSDRLDFQLYQDPSRSIIWGSQFSGSATPLKFDVVIPPRGSMPFSVTMYGRVLGGQTGVTPGAYTNIYAPGDTRVTVNAPVSSTPPGTCNTSPSGNLRFPFIVSANVVNKCTITASPLNFGSSIGLLTTAVNANTAISVQCSVGSAYNVGLNAGVNGGGNINARKMLLGGNTVSYQLYRDLARTQVWGSTIGTNTVAGTGNGNTQNLTVYGRVPAQTTPPAGTYNDIIVVTVTY